MLWSPPPGFQNIMWRFVSYLHPLLHPEHWKTLAKDSYCSGQPSPFWNLLSVCQLPALTFSLTSHGLAAEKRTRASLIPPLKKQLCSLHCVFRELIKCANPTPKCPSVCYDGGESASWWKWAIHHQSGYLIPLSAWWKDTTVHPKHFQTHFLFLEVYN